MTPFLTLYTPTYKRPKQLAACLASVASQSMVTAIEHLVVPDHVGVGIAGMYERVKDYADAVHGQYVHLLGDDDVLGSPTVVEEVYDFATALGFPPVILVAAQKGGDVWPAGQPWPPRCGRIDLGCVITRADVWKAHAKDYGLRYEGDYDFMHALWRAGYPAVWCDVLFSIGAVSRGAAEVAA
jgi:hypothetical protein